jgi:hypothetical protein
MASCTEIRFQSCFATQPYGLARPAAECENSDLLDSTLQTSFRPQKLVWSSPSTAIGAERSMTLGFKALNEKSLAEYD